MFSNKRFYWVIFFITGFSAICAQLLFLNEFFSLFFGNEIAIGIFLGAWLFWTALGSWVTGKYFIHRKNPADLVAALQFLFAVTLPLTIFTLRLSPIFWQRAAGELPGFLPTAGSAFLILSLFCFLSGGLFSVSSSLLVKETQRNLVQATGHVYLTETLASALGGFTFSVLLISRLSIFEISLFISFLNLFSFFILKNYFCEQKIKRFTFSGLLLLWLVAQFSAFSAQQYGTSWRWPGFRVVSETESHYGRLTILSQGENRTLLQNGLRSFTLPNVEQAEETVHFALLSHPKPQQVLVIGNVFSGVAKELLKYASLTHVDLTEIDPALVTLARKWFPRQWRIIRQSPRLSLHIADGRRFLQQSTENYDVIIINLPDPSTARLNRFYTVEFFNLCSEHLKKDGVLSLSISGSENFINPQLKAYIRCELASLRSVFPYVRALPGNTIHLLASKDAAIRDVSVQIYVQRLQQRHIRTRYINAGFLPFRLAPQRLQFFHRQLQTDQIAYLNSDLYPLAYFFNFTLWNSHFSPYMANAFLQIQQVPFASLTFWLVLGIILILITLLTKKGPGNLKIAGGFSMLVFGFTVMSLEIAILLLYQTYHGSLYFEVALLFATFMLGMSCGTWFALKKWQTGRLRLLVILHVLSILSAFLILWLVRSGLVSDLIFFVAIFFIGAIGGLGFLLNSEIYFSAASGSNPGILYGLDLSGALISSLIFTTFILPIYGFWKSAVFIGVFNLIAMLVFLVSFLRKN